MDLTEKKLKKKIFKYLRPLIKNPTNIEWRGNEDAERILELEYQYYFEGDPENAIYKL